MDNLAHYIDLNCINFPSKFQDTSFDYAEGWNTCIDAICMLPKISLCEYNCIEAKWEISPDGYYPYCSNCGEEPQDGTNLKPYCANCGAKMIDGPDSFLKTMDKLLRVKTDN